MTARAKENVPGKEAFQPSGFVVADPLHEVHGRAKPRLRPYLACLWIPGRPTGQAQVLLEASSKVRSSNSIVGRLKRGVDRVLRLLNVIGGPCRWSAKSGSGARKAIPAPG